MNQKNAMVIDASPTKSFFISMLVKDIPLARAVIDLVDNSVDGARRLRSNGHYEGLWVHLEIDSMHFRISDNCGGIPVEVAQKYAFRFGRPEDAPNTPHSVGQFGVGMKRAIFKFGRRFTVSSKCAREYFVIDEIIAYEESDEDADPGKAWADKEDAWEFNFRELKTNLPEEFPDDEQGTTIEVSKLYDSISQDFGSDSFPKKLLLELQTAQQNAIDNGLHITINGIPLHADPIELLVSNEIKPVYRTEEFEVDGTNVYVRIYAGISERNPAEAGWYVYCNGRLILQADQSNITGWRESGLESSDVDAGVQYHNDFARFRGYVYFESSDTSKLPWNTTKTGVDSDTPIYKNVRGIMVTTMTPILSFLRKLTREMSESSDNQLELSVEKAKAAPLSSLGEQQIFVSPSGQPPLSSRLVTISYKRDRAEVEKARELLSATSYKDVGEKTFEYFWKMEGLE